MSNGLDAAARNFSEAEGLAENVEDERVASCLAKLAAGGAILARHLRTPQPPPAPERQGDSPHQVMTSAPGEEPSDKELEAIADAAHRQFLKTCPPGPPPLPETITWRRRERRATYNAGRESARSEAEAMRRVAAQEHNLRGNCWGHDAVYPHEDNPDPLDVCREHGEQRGDCSNCPACPVCDEPDGDWTLAPIPRGELEAMRKKLAAWAPVVEAVGQATGTNDGVTLRIAMAAFDALPASLRPKVTP